jgi:hypothetical protein
VVDAASAPAFAERVFEKKYDSGASIRALAEETGRSYGGVHRLLEDAKTTFRSRGGAPRRTES